MSIRFKTSDPQKLLTTFKKAIDEHKIITWSYDQDGDFTHSVEQWKNTAWLRPEIGVNELIFIIIGPLRTTITSEVYGIYHGRFVESMLIHCDSLFTNATASALPSDGDSITS